MGVFHFLFTAFYPKKDYLVSILTNEGNQIIYLEGIEDIPNFVSGLYTYPGTKDSTSSMSILSSEPTDNQGRIRKSQRDNGPGGSYWGRERSTGRSVSAKGSSDM